MLPGSALIYAIAAMVIISSFALLLLSYTGINYRYVDLLKKREITNAYCLQGLGILKNGALEYNIPYTFSLDNSFRLKLEKRHWGLFDLYYSSVLKSNGDSLLSKLALIGYEKGDDSTALFLQNSNIRTQVGERVYVSGKCYLPGSILKLYKGGAYDNIQLNRIYESPDTFPHIVNTPALKEWIDNLATPYKAGYERYTDSITNSFYSSTRLLAADTLFLGGYMAGNIIACANTIIAEPGAALKDVILLARSVRIDSGFSGSIQVIAFKSIEIGKNVKLRYPSTIALLPDMDIQEQGTTIFTIADSFCIDGSVYASTADAERNKYLNISFGKGSIINGAIYSSSALIWQGKCNGTVICKGLVNRRLMETNLLSDININVDSLPRYYSYDLLFPMHGGRKIVAWLN